MAAAMGAGLLVSGRAGTWRGGPGERPGRGQEAGGELRRALREGAVLGPHASGRGLRGRVPARRGFLEKVPSSSSSPALWFPCAQSPCVARGFCFPKPVRDCKGQAGRTLPRVGQHGSRFGVSTSRVPHGSPGSGTAVVGAWTQKDLGPLCRGHTASGLGSPVTCCVQLQGPSRAVSGCVRTLPPGSVSPS